MTRELVDKIVKIIKKFVLMNWLLKKYIFLLYFSESRESEMEKSQR